MFSGNLLLCGESPSTDTTGRTVTVCLCVTVSDLGYYRVYWLHFNTYLSCKPTYPVLEGLHFVNKVNPADGPQLWAALTQDIFHFADVVKATLLVTLLFIILTRGNLYFLA